MGGIYGEGYEPEAYSACLDHFRLSASSLSEDALSRSIRESIVLEKKMYDSLTTQSRVTKTNKGQKVNTFPIDARRRKPCGDSKSICYISPILLLSYSASGISLWPFQIPDVTITRAFADLCCSSCQQMIHLRGSPSYRP